MALKFVAVTRSVKTGTAHLTASEYVEYLKCRMAMSVRVSGMLLLSRAS